MYNRFGTAVGTRSSKMKRTQRLLKDLDDRRFRKNEMLISTARNGATASGDVTTNLSGSPSPSLLVMSPADWIPDRLIEAHIF